MTTEHVQNLSTPNLYNQLNIAFLVFSAWQPGLDWKPNFRQFSGYLTVDEDTGRNIFYWYVESQNDPKNDPLVYWSNGTYKFRRIDH